MFPVKTLSACKYEIFVRHTVEKTDFELYNDNRKRQDLKRLCQEELSDSPNLTGGGYLSFCVSTIKKIIVSINTRNICFSIVTTSFPDL